MERLGPVTLSDVAEAFGELLAEAGSYPGDAAPVYGEADGWAEEPGMPAAPVTFAIASALADSTVFSASFTPAVIIS